MSSTPRGRNAHRRTVKGGHKRVIALGFSKRELVEPRQYTPVRRSPQRAPASPRVPPRPASDAEPLVLPPLVSNRKASEEHGVVKKSNKYSHITPRIDTHGRKPRRKKKGDDPEAESIREQIPEGMRNRPLRELKAYLKAVSHKKAHGPADEDPALVALNSTQGSETPRKPPRRRINRIGQVQSREDKARQRGDGHTADGSGEPEGGAGKQYSGVPALSPGAAKAMSTRGAAPPGWEEGRQQGDAVRRSSSSTVHKYLEGWEKCELLRQSAVERTAHQLCQDKAMHNVPGPLGDYIEVWFADRYGVKNVVEKQIKKFIANAYYYAQKSPALCAFCHIAGLSSTYPSELEAFYFQLLQQQIRLRLRLHTFGNKQWMPLASCTDLALKYFGAIPERANKLVERLENAATAFRETRNGLIPLNNRESKVMVVLGNTARLLAETSRDLRDLYDQMDNPDPSERTGSVDSDGLLGGLSELGVNLTSKDAHTVLKLFRAQDGYISWGDFKRGMTSRLNRISVTTSRFTSLMLTEWVEMDLLLDQQIIEMYDSQYQADSPGLTREQVSTLVSDSGAWVTRSQIANAIPGEHLNRAHAFVAFRQLGLVRMTRSSSHEQSMAKMQKKARNMKSRASLRPKTSHHGSRSPHSPLPPVSPSPEKKQRKARPKTAAAPATPPKEAKEEEVYLYHGPMLPPTPPSTEKPNGPQDTIEASTAASPDPAPVATTNQTSDQSALAALAAQQEEMLAELAKIDAKQTFVGFALSIDIMDGEHQRLSDCRAWSTLPSVTSRLPLELAPPRPVACEDMQVYVEPMSGEPQFVEVQQPPGIQAEIETKIGFSHIVVQAFALIGNSADDCDMVSLGSLSRTRKQLVELSRLHDVDEWGTGCQVTLESDENDDGDTLAGDVNLFYYPGYRPQEGEEVDVFRDVHLVIEWRALMDNVPIRRYEKADGTVAIVHKFS